MELHKKNPVFNGLLPHVLFMYKMKDMKLQMEEMVKGIT